MGLAKRRFGDCLLFCIAFLSKSEFFPFNFRMFSVLVIFPACGFQLGVLFWEPFWPSGVSKGVLHTLAEDFEVLT